MSGPISGFFSVLGLVLAAMGIFAIASSAVAQRTRELGIRRALGAGQWVLVRDSLREKLVVIGLGLSAGALGAFVAVRVTSSLTADLLFGLTARDAGNLVASVAVIVLVGLAACALPALRATRIDPCSAFGTTRMEPQRIRAPGRRSRLCSFGSRKWPHRDVGG